MTANPPPPPNPPALPAPPAPPPAPPAAPPSPPPSGGNPPWSESLTRDILRWEQELKRVSDRLTVDQVRDVRAQIDRVVTETRVSQDAALGALEARLLAQHGDKLHSQVEIVRAGIQQAVSSLQTQLTGTPAGVNKELGPRLEALKNEFANATTALKNDLAPRFDALSAQLVKATAELKGDIDPRFDTLKEHLGPRLEKIGDDIVKAGLNAPGVTAHFEGRSKHIRELTGAVIVLLFVVSLLGAVGKKFGAPPPWQPPSQDPALTGAVDEVRKGQKELQAALTACAQGRQELLAELKSAREDLKQIEGRCEAPQKVLSGRPPAACSKGPRVQINNNLCSAASPASESPAR